MSRIIKGHFIRMLVLIVSLMFIGADLSASAQNANSSTTTMQEGAPVENTNTSNNVNMNRGGRRRGRRRGGNMNAAQTPALPLDGSQIDPQLYRNVPYGATQGSGRCDPMAQEQTDLSGTYTGTVNYSEGGLSGDTTLTIRGNNFTMTNGSNTQEGRVVAVTTCNYTAVTMMFGREQVSAATGPQPPALPVVSLRAKRVGGGLTLESVEGETRQFSFNSTSVGEAKPTRRSYKRAGKRIGAPIPVGIKPPTAMSHAH
jgi:hypothetical protein